MVEYAECECELGEFAVAHHHVGLEMAFRRTHAREIDAVACAPVVFAEVEQVACHHCHIGAPVFKTYQHTHADFVHSGLPHAVESVDTPFKVRFHSCRVVCFVPLAVVGFLKADHAVKPRSGKAPVILGRQRHHLDCKVAEVWAAHA